MRDNGRCMRNTGCISTSSQANAAMALSLSAELLMHCNPDAPVSTMIARNAPEERGT
jgi:hypothetical protein